MDEHRERWPVALHVFDCEHAYVCPRWNVGFVRSKERTMSGIYLRYRESFRTRGHITPQRIQERRYIHILQVACFDISQIKMTQLGENFVAHRKIIRVQHFGTVQWFKEVISERRSDGELLNQPLGSYAPFLQFAQRFLGRSNEHQRAPERGV